MNLFEVASKKKFRFESDRGMLTVEQLWDASPTLLDTVYHNLQATLKEIGEDSLFDNKASQKSKFKEEVSTKIELVRYIANVRQEAQQVRDRQKARAEEKQRLLEILANKQDSALQALSEEELQKRISELG